MGGGDFIIIFLSFIFFSFLFVLRGVVNSKTFEKIWRSLRNFRLIISLINKKKHTNIEIDIFSESVYEALFSHIFTKYLGLIFQCAEQFLKQKS